MRVCERFRTILLGQESIIPNSTSKTDRGKASSAPESITCIPKVHILNMTALIEIYIVHINFFFMYHRIKKEHNWKGWECDHPCTETNNDYAAPQSISKLAI